MAASALRADGVDAFVGNEHHAHMEWWAVAALGGVQVLVPSNAQAHARQLLRDRLEAWSEGDREDRVARRDRWRAWTMFVLVGGPALGLVPFAVGHAIAGIIAGQHVEPRNGGSVSIRAASEAYAGQPLSDEEFQALFEQLNEENRRRAYAPSLPAHYGD